MEVDKDKIFRGYLPPISQDNELAAWQHIKYVALDALGKFPKTIKQDKKRLKGHKFEKELLSENEINCIKYNLIEKIPLQFMI